MNGDAYIQIVNGAAALTKALKDAGIQGQVRITVLGDDGERLHDAIGRGQKARGTIKVDGNMRIFETAGVQFRWGPTDSAP